eukprot:Nitzschia sp. Nitz4//scaffold27_size158506//39010//39258//NITZ4_002588-RA/size158506-processed-gene-0.9-mRNA-1//1//CDS//3329545452//5293//frame0
MTDSPQRKRRFARRGACVFSTLWQDASATIIMDEPSLEERQFPSTSMHGDLSPVAPSRRKREHNFPGIEESLSTKRLVLAVI